MLTAERITQLGDEVKSLANRLTVDDQAMKAMHEIYIIAYGEIYDPVNKETARMAERLIPHVRLLNDKFKFKR